MTADRVAKLTEAISELQQDIGIEATRKLLLGLAGGLGAPEEEFGVETGSSRPDARP